MDSENTEGAAHASPRQVAVATLLAVLISGFVLVAFILPAEFGTDPLGSGELLGLTALSRAGENPLENQPIQHKTDYREFILEPFQSIEYKYLMDLGSTLVFSWEADGELYYDFHADPSTPGEEDVASFEIGDSNSAQGTYHALFSGIRKHPAPEILHSDRGSEYTGKDMRIILELLGTKQSMSRAGCPWENGYQESFYSHFKVDLGDPNRFSSLGELVYEIYRLIHSYNTDRIHTALRMPPETFSLRYATTQFLISSNVS